MVSPGAIVSVNARPSKGIILRLTISLSRTMTSVVL